VSVCTDKGDRGLDVHFIVQVKGSCFLLRTQATSRLEISVLCHGNLVPEAGAEGVGREVARGENRASHVMGCIVRGGVGVSPGVVVWADS
jgi:hypothetical protein